MESETKQCQNCHSEFVIEPDDFAFYKKMKVPPPTWCPDCRLQRRLTFRNERALYKRKCDLCGKDTLSRFDPEKGMVSYCGACWWSDKWDPMKYGQDYDFSRPFFEQWRELLEKVPQFNLITLYNTLVDTEFVNMNHYLKDCYYIFNSDYDERCMYGEEMEKCKDCMDVTMADSTELAYESLNCMNCYKIYYSIDCDKSHDVWFSKNLIGCSDCFGCVNLKNKQYYIFNKPYVKEEYQKKISKYKLDSYTSVQDLKREAEGFWLKFPVKYMHGIKNLNSSGDYIYNSKYVKNSFIVTESQYCRYCMWLIVKGNKECYDFTQYGENTELVYETLCSGKGIYNVIGGINSIEGRDMRYAAICYNNNNHIFGCISLKNKQYCILNKQYTKEEYERFVPEVIEHMNDMPYIDKIGRKYVYGDFYPSEIAQFDYNETSAQEFFPLNKQQAQEQGYSWKEEKEKNYKITVEPKDLPDSILDVKDDITSQIIGCAHKGECNEQCATAFRIIPQELQFYKSQNLPLPRLCPNCRHYQRVKNRNPIKLWHRKCMKPGCTNEFETSYAPDRPEIVYCEQCYQQEVA